MPPPSPPTSSRTPSPTDPVEELFSFRTVELAFHRRRLHFDLARTVFSASSVDPGSAFLLRHLQTVPLDHVERVLDIGSGHGVLGIVLKALDPDRHLTAVDRDALACRYTIRNLGLNGLVDPPPGSPSTTLDVPGCRVVGSLGYDAIGDGDRYDLIVSNLPGKAGEGAIRALVQGAASVAVPGAVAGYVVVTPLAGLVAEAVAEAGFEVLVDKGNRTHHVIVAAILDPAPRPRAPGLDQGRYDRHRSTFAHGPLEWEATTVVGLPEFDSLSYGTRLLRSALQGIPAGPSVVVDPGQGHRAVVAAASGYPPAVVVGRDRLALEATRRLLVDSGRPIPDLVHDVSLGPALVDDRPIIMHAEDKVHAPWFTHQVQAALHHLSQVPGRPTRDLVLTGRAGLLGRLEAEVLRRAPGRVAHKASQRGFRALRVRVKGPARG